MEPQKNTKRDKKVLEIFTGKLFKSENKSLFDYINTNREFSDSIFGEEATVDSIKNKINKIPEPKFKKKSKKQPEKAKEERKKLKDSFLQLLYLAENEYEKSQQEKTQNPKEHQFKNKNLNDKKTESTEPKKDGMIFDFFINKIYANEKLYSNEELFNSLSYFAANENKDLKSLKEFIGNLKMDKVTKDLINDYLFKAEETYEKNQREKTQKLKEIEFKNKNLQNKTNINSINIINEEHNMPQKQSEKNGETNVGKNYKKTECKTDFLPYSFTYEDYDDFYKGEFKQNKKIITNELGFVLPDSLPVPVIHKELTKERIIEGHTNRLVDFLFDMSNRLDSCIECIITELFTELSSSIGPNKGINKNNKFSLYSYNSLRHDEEEYNKLISRKEHRKEYTNVWQFYGVQVYDIENILYDLYVGYVEKGENFFLTNNKSGDTDIPGYGDFFRDYIKEMKRVRGYKITKYKDEDVKNIYLKTKEFIIKTMKHEIEIERKIIEQAMTVIFFYPNKKESSDLIFLYPNEIESLFRDYIKEIKEEIKEKIKEAVKGEIKLDEKELDKRDTGEAINFLEKNYSGKFNMDKLMETLTKEYSNRPVARGLIHYSDNVRSLMNLLQYLSKKEPGKKLFDDSINKLAGFLEKNEADKLDTDKLIKLLEQYLTSEGEHTDLKKISLEGKPSNIRMAHGLISLLKENYLDRLGMDKLRKALQFPEESELHKLNESREQLTWSLIKNDLNKILKKDNQFFDEFVNCEIESKKTPQITALRCFIFVCIAHKYLGSQEKNFENMDKVYSELRNNHCGWCINIYRALAEEILNCLNKNKDQNKEHHEKTSYNSNLYNQNNLSNGIKKQTDLTKHDL